MYKTFQFNENAPNEIVTALVRGKKVNSLSDVLSYMLTEHKYRQIKSEHLRKFFEEVFWASTFTEERNFHLPSVSLTPPTSFIGELLDVGNKHKFHFNDSIPFEAKNLAKLAAALETTDYHLGVWINENNNLEIWGFTNESEFIAKAVEVGQILLIKRESNYTTAKRILIDYSKIAFVKNFDTLFPVERQKVFTELVRYIRNHRHGGTILVVSGNIAWRKSIDSAIYFNPVNQSLKDFTDELIENKNENAAYKIRNIIGEMHLKLLGRITAPDGATIVNQELEIIAFGAKVKPKSRTKMTEITIIEPFENSKEKIIPFSELGGTRHQSSARFVFDQKNKSFAIVASQDGKISVMNWDKDKKQVCVIQHAEYLFV